jgi:hypothetical protein
VKLEASAGSEVHAAFLRSLTVALDVASSAMRHVRLPDLDAVVDGPGFACFACALGAGAGAPAEIASAIA